MKIEKQEVDLPVQNLEEIMGSGAVKNNKHGVLLPDSIRSIICGPSSSGKTNVLINLICSPNGLRFENIYVFSKSLYQPKYQFLKNVMPKEVGYFEFGDNELVVHPNKARKNSIMIFDDISCEKHNNIRSYFTMGRHNNIDIFYLGQTYSAIPKQLVRDNSNFIILFKQDEMNLKHIYNDHVTTDMSFDKFKEICAKAWQDNFGFLVIDKTLDPYKGRYRIGLDSFVVEL
jgi:hypothetical protein